MGRILYDIEIGQTPNSYTAKLKSNVKPQKPLREYKGATFEEILDQIVRDILDENEDQGEYGFFYFFGSSTDF